MKWNRRPEAQRRHSVLSRRLKKYYFRGENEFLTLYSGSKYRFKYIVFTLFGGGNRAETGRTDRQHLTGDKWTFKGLDLSSGAKDYTDKQSEDMGQCPPDRGTWRDTSKLPFCPPPSRYCRSPSKTFFKLASMLASTNAAVCWVASTPPPTPPVS